MTEFISDTVSPALIGEIVEKVIEAVLRDLEIEHPGEGASYRPWVEGLSKKP